MTVVFRYRLLAAEVEELTFPQPLAALGRTPHNLALVKKFL